MQRCLGIEILTIGLFLYVTTYRMENGHLITGGLLLFGKQKKGVLQYEDPGGIGKVVQEVQYDWLVRIVECTLNGVM